MLSFALPLLLAAAPAPALADYAPGDLADARCLAAYAMLAADKDPKLQQAGTIGTVYFVGKLNGRGSHVSLEAILRSVADEVKRNQASYLTSCGAELTSVGNTMTDAGKALSNAGI